MRELPEITQQHLWSSLVLEAFLPLPAADKGLKGQGQRKGSTDPGAKEVTSRVESVWFHPRTGGDQFFWCFHYACHGEEEYRRATEHAYENEMKEKFAVAQRLSMHKLDLRICKVTQAGAEAELSNGGRVGLAGLRALCIVRGVGAIVARGGFFSRWGAKPRAVFIIEGRGRMKVSLDERVIEDAQRARICVADIAKPLKAMASYRLAELRDMSETLGLPTARGGKSLTRTQLHEAIVRKTSN